MKTCLHCNQEIKTGKFCSSSHSAIYNNTHHHWRKVRGITPKTKSCVNCGATMSHKNKDCCSSKCSVEYKWKNETVPRIQLGQGGIRVLRKFLIETRGEKCECCGLPPVWNGQKLSLHLDHIDGNSDNNLPSNVRLMCPNCHSQTDTYGSKGQGNRYKKSTKRNRYLQKYKMPG